jgi:hypothetical protein
VRIRENLGVCENEVVGLAHTSLISSHININM